MCHIHVYTGSKSTEMSPPVTLQNETSESRSRGNTLIKSHIHLVISAMAPSLPKAPQKRPQTPLRTPGTPWQCEFPLSNCLQGIKPLNLSFTQIKKKLIEKLKLLFTPDKWQLHLISWIRQVYNSIFYVGTGYGKSLIFKGLAVLGGKSRVVMMWSS